MTDPLNIYKEALHFLENCIADPDKFLEPQQEQAAYYKKLTKQLYKTSFKLQNGQIANSKALPTLLVDGFDEEQIWQQLELKNVPVLKYYQKCISDFNAESLINICNENAYTDDDAVCNKSSSDENENEGYVFDDDDDSGSEFSDSMISRQFEKPNENRTKKQKSIVDDQFFKQSQLEEFLKIEDMKFEREVDGKKSTIDDSEEIDWEKNYSDDDDEELEKKSSRNLMYTDFFDPPEDSEDDEDDRKEDEKNESTDGDDDDEIMRTINREEYDTRDYEPDDEENEDSEKLYEKSPLKGKDLFDEDNSGSDNEKDKTKAEEKTAFQKQVEKEQKRIKDMEEKLLQPKPWQLTGEVDASHRPENSLMKQPTVFSANVKQSIELTDDLTTKIEEIIHKAISNKAWCDVERKIKPIENVRAYKKTEPLEQTKSKKSLAEVYEDDYLKLKNKSEDVEDPRHTEILKLMDELTPELYALFSHIPKPPVPEIKVVSNMPAIAVEEVAPVGLSDAALLAPEEIKKKPKGDVKGDTEKSATDKKRERRKKKLFQKLKQKKKEEKLQELAVSNPLLAKKHEKLLALQQLKRSKNATIAKSDSSKKIKSSKDFFARLDETVNKKSAKLKR